MIFDQQSTQVGGGPSGLPNQRVTLTSETCNTTKSFSDRNQVGSRKTVAEPAEKIHT